MVILAAPSGRRRIIHIYLLSLSVLPRTELLTQLDNCSEEKVRTLCALCKFTYWNYGEITVDTFFEYQPTLMVCNWVLWK